MIDKSDSIFNNSSDNIVHDEEIREIEEFIEKDIFILLAASESRLSELISLVDLLEGKCIILIVPDESNASLSMAIQFFPRFFTPVSETYSDLCDVLNKMINQANNKTKLA